MLKTVLHIDDDPAILRLVDIVLSKRGYNPISIEKPDQALSTLLKTGARVVLLDMDMAGVDGLTVLRAVKAQDAGIQVIILSATLSMVSIVKTMELGAEECLFKPITNLQVLLGAVERAFAKIERWRAAMKECAERRPRPIDTDAVLQDRV